MTKQVFFYPKIFKADRVLLLSIKMEVICTKLIQKWTFSVNNFITADLLRSFKPKEVSSHKSEFLSLSVIYNFFNKSFGKPSMS